MTKTSKNNFTLFKLSTPIFFETLLFMLLGFIDTFMLSKFSDNAVAAVGVTNQLMFMINIMFSVISGATGILVAQYVGADDDKMASKTTAVSIIVNLIIGIVISILMVAGGRVFFKLLKIRPELFKYAMDYMNIVGGFLFIQALLMTLTAVVRSRGFTMISMLVTVGMNMLNIIGDYVAIFGPFGLPKLGVKGVAIATTMSKFVGLLIMIYVIFFVIEKKFIFKLLKPFPFDILRNLLKIGLPSAGEQLSYNLSQIVCTYFINILGNNALTAKTYAQNIVMFSFVLTSAIGQGNMILVGHLIGKNNKNEAYKTCFKSLKIAILSSVSISFIFILFRGQIFSIFTDNIEIIKICGSILIVDIFLEIGRALNIVIINSLRAAGDVKFPVYMAIIFEWGISVLFAYILGIYFNLGLVGIWIAFALDEWCRGIIMYFRWKSQKWRRMDFINNAAVE